MPKRYIKDPVTVEALRWTGDNYAEVKAWVGDDFDINYEDSGVNHLYTVDWDWVPIATGDWIVRDELGFRPIMNAVFTAVYRELEE